MDKYQVAWNVFRYVFILQSLYLIAQTWTFRIKRLNIVTQDGCGMMILKRRYLNLHVEDAKHSINEEIKSKSGGEHMFVFFMGHIWIVHQGHNWKSRIL